MHIQEQEERDYFPQTEYQNAFALSRMEFDNGKGKIDGLLALGLYVAVAEVDAYCPITDAGLGVQYIPLAACKTRREAEAALVDDEPCYVLPRRK